MGLFDFWKKLKKAYKDSQIWHKIETSEDLKQAYKDSYEKPVIIQTCATMHFRSDYMISDLESQARKMNLSEVKFYKLNYTGNSLLKDEISSDLGIEIPSATFIVFKNGQAIFKRHEETINMAKLLEKLRNY